MVKRRKRKEKKSNFVEDETSDFSIYKRGATVGALLGGIVGLVLGKRIILSIVVGAVVGGYISYQVNKDEAPKKKFSKDDSGSTGKTSFKKFKQNTNTNEDADN